MGEIVFLQGQTLHVLSAVEDCFSTAARRGFETYFQTLQTGCVVEEIPLKIRSRLLNGRDFYNIIAWRNLYLTHFNRTSLALASTTGFADHEWTPA